MPVSAPFSIRAAAAIATPALLAGAWVGLHRSAPAVRGWEAPERSPLPGGPLFATGTVPTRPEAEAGGPVVVLLHGIVGSGRSFGRRYDTLPARVVVPDLLGFGRSMEVPTPGYAVDDHVQAVRRTLDRTGAGDRPTLVVGHSMGAVLALHLAADLPDVIGVVACSGPLYDGEEEAFAHIGEADALAGLVAAGPMAEAICHWMCAHRELASVLWPLMAPRWPWPVAADGVLHTWPSYRQSLQSLVLDSGYRDALDRLVERRVPVRLLNGADDGVPVSGRADALAAAHDSLVTSAVAGTGHELPLSRPDAVIAVIEDLLGRA